LTGATQLRSDRAVVFVHGFMSSQACWTDLISLLRADPRIAERYELLCFEYATSAIQLRLLRRLPSVMEIGHALEAFLESPLLAPFRELTLVGHSQGGLVIQSYVVDALRRGRCAPLARIRQIILIATPNHGSAKASMLRRVAGTFFDNPQELSLRVFDPQIDQIVNEMDERVESAEPGRPDGWPIPIQCFWGTEDDVVQLASARGPFNNAAPLNGDHSSILHPCARTDMRYVQLAEAILEPAGHPHVWEIANTETSIKVSPLVGPDQRVSAQHGSRTHEIVSDNVASIRRSVKFARKNRCTRPFSFPYGTRNEGFVRATMSQRNEASDQDLQVYADYGVRLVFAFTPRPVEPFWVDFEVFKGFDAGHRDMHEHLGRRQGYYRSVRLSLDLTAFLDSGYTVSAAPHLYYTQEDRGHDDMCYRRSRDVPVPCASQRPGVWVWELTEIWGGIVDLVWELADPPTRSAVPS